QAKLHDKLVRARSRAGFGEADLLGFPHPHALAACLNAAKAALDAAAQPDAVQNEWRSAALAGEKVPPHLDWSRANRERLMIEIHHDAGALATLPDRNEWEAPPAPPPASAPPRVGPVPFELRPKEYDNVVVPGCGTTHVGPRALEVLHVVASAGFRDLTNAELKALTGNKHAR